MRKHIRQHPNADSKSGVLGLCLTNRQGGRNERRHWTVVAQWRDRRRTRHQVTFSVEKYGFRTALRMGVYHLCAGRDRAGHPFPEHPDELVERAHANLVSEIPNHLLP